MNSLSGSEGTVSFGRALAPVAALLLGTALLYLGFGLQTTLVPLRAKAEGFGQLTLGLLGATYYAGFVAGCFIGPFVIQRAGHIRAFAAMVACVSAVALAFPLAVGEVWWVAFRFLVGLCLSGILIIVESWLNEKATANTRGMTMSAYTIIVYGALTLGQLGVTTQPLTDFTLFSICSILLSIAAVPVALTRSKEPPPLPAVRFRPGILWRLAPAAFVGAFVSGVLTGSVFTMSAIYAVNSGFATSQAALFASAIVLGGAIGQYPFGRSSDFMDRRLVLLAAAIPTAGLSALLVFAVNLPSEVVLALGFAFGFVMLPLYALAAAHAYDWTPRDQIVETSASLNLLFGLGSTMGPLVAAGAMLLLGPVGLFAVTAAAAAALSLFIVLRIFARRRPSEAMRTEYDFYVTAPLCGVTPEYDAAALSEDHHAASTNEAAHDKPTEDATI